MTLPLTLEPGATVAGKYRLERLIGRGGMGEVWAAEQAHTRKQVALKFLLGDSAKNPATRRRFMREARAVSAVSHPNVVQIHDVVEAEDETPILIMELLRGESLEGKLEREGSLGVEETIAVLLRVVSAVGTAHTQGVIHRDLKPDNIFLSQTPEGVEVKVLDFGIAKLGPSDDGSQTGALTSTGTMLGTPFYMSPEQAFGEKKIDHRADIWSLGIVLFRCLTGELPTRAENLGQILKIIMTRSIPKLASVAPQLPADLCALVDKMLSYSPTERPSDLREVKTALERMVGIGVEDFGPPAIDASSLGGVAILPDVRSQHVEATAPGRPSFGFVALSVAVLIALATAAFVFWRQSGAAAPAATIRDAANVEATTPPTPRTASASSTAGGATVAATPYAASAPVSADIAGSASASVSAQGRAPHALSAPPNLRPTGSAPSIKKPASPTDAKQGSAATASPTPGSGIVEKPGF